MPYPGHPKREGLREVTDNTHPSAEKTKRGPSPKSVVVLVVIAVFLGLILGKLVTDDGSGTSAPASSATTAETTITSVRNDAVADYDAALETGQPIYVLFHSMTCQPCVEISAVVDQVMPDYEDRIVFVNAITDDASAQQLAGRFQFQYIPTSFFLSPDGNVSDSFTGAMDETRLRGYLDALSEAK